MMSLKQKTIRILRKQSGFLMPVVLGFVIVVMLTGNVIFMYVRYDLAHSGREMKKTRADYTAEAALHWGLYLAEHRGNFSCATHDSTGNAALLDTNQHCAFSTEAANSLYPGETIVKDSLGWLTVTPGDTAESLSGSLNETLAVKVWYPNDTTARITGQASVDGVVSEFTLVSDLR